MNVLKLLLIGVSGVALAGCAHLAVSDATFVRSADVPDARLTLTINRHMDTIVNGPDIEEDQKLTLELSRYPLNEKIEIPSEAVTTKLVIERFGPWSRGETYWGYIIITSVGDNELVARMDLTVTAYTLSRTYKQDVHFKGEYTFNRGRSHD